MDKSKAPVLSQRRIKFELKYENFSDSQILKEILFAQEILIDKLERNRSNTSTMVWWLIAIPLIFFILIFVFSGFGALL